MNTALLAQSLWQHLWEDYRKRVSHARTYEAMIMAAGGTVANDHIAFRTLRTTVNCDEGPIHLGIPYLAVLMEWLGYEFVEDYHFPDCHLYAHYYRHPQQEEYNLPKVFISELIIEELPDELIEQIQTTVQAGHFCLLATWQYQLLDSRSLINIDQQLELIKQLAAVFSRPWSPPKRQVVEAVNAVSQYGAWVLLHGYAVNHFTGYINRQQTELYLDIESTVRELKRQGVPMKATLEGSKDTGLEQIATHAVIEPVAVVDDQGNLDEIPWSYAYYELAERHPVVDALGEKVLFEGFIGNQAQQLFEMTRTS